MEQKKDHLKNEIFVNLNLFQVLIVIDYQYDEILKQVQNDGFQYFSDSLFNILTPIFLRKVNRLVHFHLNRQ